MPPVEVVVIGYEGAGLVDIACVTTALDLATRLGAQPAYHAVVASVDGGDIRCESGLTVRAQVPLADIARADTVIVTGGRGHKAATGSATLIRHIRRLAQDARRTASVCTGAAILAEAGLLNGRRATTHWLFAKEIAERYPEVHFDSGPIFIRDDQIATSGGVTSALDLTLAFIEEDHGAELARWVAMGMVTYLQRPGNQAQLSMFTAAPRPDHATVREVIDHVLAQPDGDLSAPTLAARVGVSHRQLTRLFRQHLGEPPATAVRRIRLEFAARLLVATDVSLTQVARRSGFASAETLRQAFAAKYGISPRAFRQAYAATSSPADPTRQ
jgi:transcriptional regulator GlxA family with amidase domain